MILFKPAGTLNIATAATDLPEQSENGAVYSGAMTRCKNMNLDTIGNASVTRHGSSRPTSNLLEAKANLIIEQSGNRYSFAGQTIYKDELSISTGLTDAQWSAIKYNAYNDSTERIFALNGTDRKKITGSMVEEWGLEPPDTAATLAAGSSTGLTGAYKVKYTYAVKSGTTVITESNPSPASDSQTLSNEDLTVTWTASTDGQVTHVRIYRTLAGGDIYYHDQDVAVGTVTVDTSTADTSLGAQVATDLDRPPLGSIVLGPIYNGICFIVKDNLLYWSKGNQPEYWPTANNIEFSTPQFPGKAAVVFEGQLYILTVNQIFWIQGTVSGAFRSIPLGSITGAPNIFSAVGIKGRGIYHIGSDGLYLYSGGIDKKITESSFEPIFPDAGGINGVATNGINSVPASNATKWITSFKNKIYFHYGNGSVLVLNMDSNKAWYYKYDLQLTAPAIDYTNDNFLVGDADKYIRKIEDSSVTTDVSTSIDWEIESKDYTLQTRNHFPRWVKYDLDVSDASSVQGEIKLDGTTLHTHSITESRKPKRRLVDIGNGYKCSIFLSGTGPAKVYAIEME